MCGTSGIERLKTTHLLQTDHCLLVDISIPKQSTGAFVLVLPMDYVHRFSPLENPDSLRKVTIHCQNSVLNGVCPVGTYHTFKLSRLLQKARIII